ncbi:hypothetical protein PR202_gb04189 [Eleusine coracana subsp. coracana]|uniref:VWFA domain-containing protein n=1 Tax=Eleusine coracana subsp. coracana TaxID=191504 RepID=A0AAV5E1G3_ELECO|nr:hypothetical protein QOZ80_1BG0090180 [Eleusine coracana subsp. coracana]GJN17143.1 hypothetical protein PR202_gb04189 [Eleusine coracana subsp. coracana]
MSRPSSSQVNPVSNPPPLFPQVNVTTRTPSPTPPPTPSPFPAPSSSFSFSFAPASNPSPTPPPSSGMFSFAPANNPSPTPPPSSSLFNFNDDEPVEPPLEGWDTVPEVANNGALILTTHCEYPAVARDAAEENFAVLLHAKAPVAPAEASERAPLDLVTVLDVSYSMIGAKIALVKQAMGFVIDKLGSGDRLSVVTFSGNARRIIRLTRMSDDGKASARAAVESLRATDSTNIGAGLHVAAQVLDDRRHKNAVSSVILLSDGQDNHTLGNYGGPSYDRGGPKTYIDLVPTSLRRGRDGSALCTPVHTFGFGTDHDAAAMHAIAEATGGTFSFIENEAVVQDSFAQCIGGLLSVAVQEARINVECLDPSVRVRAVKSGQYKSHVDADGRAASVDVGELYAEEERRFLLLLDVPVAAAGDDHDHAQQQDGHVTRLIKASCTYKDAASGRSVDVAAGEDAAVVRRPVAVAAADAEPSIGWNSTSSPHSSATERRCRPHPCQLRVPHVPPPPDHPHPAPPPRLLSRASTPTTAASSLGVVAARPSPVGTHDDDFELKQPSSRLRAPTAASSLGACLLPQDRPPPFFFFFFSGSGGRPPSSSPGPTVALLLLQPYTLYYSTFCFLIPYILHPNIKWN